MQTIQWLTFLSRWGDSSCEHYNGMSGMLETVPKLRHVSPSCREGTTRAYWLVLRLSEGGTLLAELTMLHDCIVYSWRNRSAKDCSCWQQSCVHSRCRGLPRLLPARNTLRPCRGLNITTGTGKIDGKSSRRSRLSWMRLTGATHFLSLRKPV